LVRDGHGNQKKNTEKLVATFLGKEEKRWKKKHNPPEFCTKDIPNLG